MLGHACVHQEEIYCQNCDQQQKHTLEFGTITNSQHQKLRSFSLAWKTLSVVFKKSHCKWIDKFSPNQERPPIPLLWPVKLGINLTCLEILNLENAGF